MKRPAATASNPVFAGEEPLSRLRHSTIFGVGTGTMNLPPRRMYSAC